MALPNMTRIQQQFEAPVLTDLPAAIHAELDRINATTIVKPGETVAITAGSRGVANVDVSRQSHGRLSQRTRRKTVCGSSDGQPRRRNR